MNLEIIASNLAEAREELLRIEANVAAGKLDEASFQVGLQHAYFHLNFAWNIRHVETQQYATLTQELFDEWSKYPSDIDEL